MKLRKTFLDTSAIERLLHYMEEDTSHVGNCEKRMAETKVSLNFRVKGRPQVRGSPARIETSKKEIKWEGKKPQDSARPTWELRMERPVLFLAPSGCKLTATRDYSRLVFVVSESLGSHTGAAPSLGPRPEDEPHAQHWQDDNACWPLRSRWGESFLIVVSVYDRCTRTHCWVMGERALGR